MRNALRSVAGRARENAKAAQVCALKMLLRVVWFLCCRGPPCLPPSSSQAMDEPYAAQPEADECMKWPFGYLLDADEVLLVVDPGPVYFLPALLSTATA